MHLLFLHPMKTAGSKVKFFFKHKLNEHGNVHKTVRGTVHDTPSQLLWRMEWDETFLDQCYKVTFVRNPYDRLVSFYHHMRQIGGHAEGICRRLTFKEFVFHPQLDQIMLPFSAYQTHGVDCIIRYEHLHEDVMPLIERFFGDESSEVKKLWLPDERIMATERAPYQEYYNKEMYAHIHWRYAGDFEANGYQNGILL